MASFVVKHKNLNIKNITFSDIKQTKMGGSNIYIRYKNPANTSQEHNLYVQTPKMFCPFGASAFKQTDNTQLPRYNLNLSFGKDKSELKKFQSSFSFSAIPRGKSSFKKTIITYTRIPICFKFIKYLCHFWITL